MPENLCRHILDVLDVDGLAGGEHLPCDALVAREAQFLGTHALCHHGPKLICFLIEEEQGTAIGFEDVRGALHDHSQQWCELGAAQVDARQGCMG